MNIAYLALVLGVVWRRCACLEKMICKGIGEDKNTITCYGTTVKTLAYYELDLFPNQYITIDTSMSSADVKKIEPIGEGRYYTQIYQSDKGATRASASISDIGPISLQKSDVVFTLYYDPEKVADKMTKMHFDLLGSAEDLKIAIQINVMPDVKKIPWEETVDLMDQDHKLVGAKEYVKEIREGTKLKVYCKGAVPTVKNEKDFVNELTKVTYHNAGVEPKQTGDFVEMELVNLAMSVDIDIKCQNDPYPTILLKRFEFYKHKGFNFKMTLEDNLDKLENEFKVVNDIISVDLPKDYVYPFSCPEQAMDLRNNLVALTDYVRGSKITKISREVKLLEMTRVSRYNKTNLKCKMIRDVTAPEFKLIIQPTCNLTDPTTLDKNGFSCTLFIETDGSARIHKTDALTVHKVLEHKLYYLEDPEKMQLGSAFADIIPANFKGATLTVNETGNHVEVKVRGTWKPKHNPVFVILNDKEGTPKHVVRMYFTNREPKYLENFMKMRSFAMKGGAEPKGEIINVVARKRTALDCNNFLQGSVLYPQGKNTVYRNVDDLDKHYDAFEKVQLEEAFGVSGITVLKRPESIFDLEIIMEDDYEIAADHFRPIFFICGNNIDAETWKKSPEPYVVIAVDPIYGHNRYHGCGVKPDLFLDAQDKQAAQKDCEFDLAKHENVRFHCPDQVPEHFLQGAQQQYEPNVDEMLNENPFFSLVRCYDRSSFLNRLLRTRRQVAVLKPRKAVSELRSMWEVDANLMRSLGITSAVCVCYNKAGEGVSSIRLKL